MPKISICIPIHDTPNTAFYLARMMKSIEEQTLKDYEIVITKEGAFAENHNAAIKKAKGEIIQMMQMDDYFAGPESLQNIVDSFKEEPNPMNYCKHGTHYQTCGCESGVVTWTPHKWQITACLHDREGNIGWPHAPYWTDDIYTGNNRLGSVSTLSMKRESALLFEEPLTWLVDVDLYYRLYLKYGLPYIHQTPTVVIDTRIDRLSHTLTDQLKANEVEYLTKKYGK